MSTSIPVAAGAVATVLFAASALPMLRKAVRTKDLASYSRSNLVMANVGNLFYSVYVFHLPPGPIWLLHTFYLASSALMLLWSLRYAVPRPRAEEYRRDSEESWVSTTWQPDVRPTRSEPGPRRAST